MTRVAGKELTITVSSVYDGTVSYWFSGSATDSTCTMGTDCNLIPIESGDVTDVYFTAPGYALSTSSGIDDNVFEASTAFTGENVKSLADELQYPGFWH
jgi:hypothetical protein